MQCVQFCQWLQPCPQILCVIWLMDAQVKLKTLHEILILTFNIKQ